MPILGIIASQGRVSPTSYESIATTTVGSGGAASISFTSIPSTYTHLQLRYFGKLTGNTQYWGTFNNDTSSSYSLHFVYGEGTNATSSGGVSQNYLYFGYAGWTSEWAAGVTDILDYKNTNKYKTFRNLYGSDNNGTGGIMFTSSLWQSTNAITSIQIFANNSSNFSEYTQFALYGIKGV